MMHSPTTTLSESLMPAPRKKNGSASTRILLISDRPAESSLELLLANEGAVETCEDLDRANFKLQTRSYETVVLDLKQTPGANYSFLLRWRREGVDAHLIVVLPRGSGSSDRAATLDAGADACLVHPLANEELSAHLRALQRRSKSVGSPVRRIHDLEINTAVRSVTRAGKPIHLTPREFDLLHLLATHQGKVLTRSMIVQHLYDDVNENYSNVVDVYIRYLRGKIDKGHPRPLILTRWGEGYMLRAEGA